MMKRTLVLVTYKLTCFKTQNLSFISYVDLGKCDITKHL